jgi:hypothetical protein
VWDGQSLSCQPAVRVVKPGAKQKALVSIPRDDFSIAFFIGCCARVFWRPVPDEIAIPETWCESFTGIYLMLRHRVWSLKK